MAGTPHIAAEKGDFAELVLMPGDPLRAQALAKRHLEGARCVNEVRNMLAYTGNWRGKPVSIMGSGMGMPSISIYAHELFQDFGVQSIVRVGTCGGLLEDMQLGDLVLASAASTDSSMNRLRFHGWDYAAAADPGLLRAVQHAASEADIAVRVGEIFSTDFFYHPDPEFVSCVQSMGILGLDMETAALYAIARAQGRKALTILTVSDVIPTGLQASPEARQDAFGSVIEVVLSALLGAD